MEPVFLFFFIRKVEYIFVFSKYFYFPFHDTTIIVNIVILIYIFGLRVGV